jgi:hypothetical protein
MIEPLFGTASPIWTGPAPGAFGWAVPVGTRPLVSPVMTFGQPQVSPPATSAVGLAAGRPQTIPSPAVLSPEMYDFGRSATGGQLPAALPPEIAFGYSVPALLTTIAMRRGQPLGPTNDQEIEDFLYDALELLAGTSEVEVRCDGGRATLTGTVQHKRLKHDVGEIAWGIPSLNDVQNNVAIATRRRTRPANREPEPQQQPGRK